VLNEYVAYYHSERTHQGKSNLLLFPRISEIRGGVCGPASGLADSCVITVKTRLERLVKGLMTYYWLLSSWRV
jgi:hypothetical protein